MKFLQTVRLAARCASISTLLLIASCAQVPATGTEREEGPILEVRTGRFIAQKAVLEQALAARFVILGEMHDNPVHHRLQAEILSALIRAGRRPDLAMEQFDREHQSGLDRALAESAGDAEALARAGHFDRRGWDWPAYKPLVEIAAANRLRIVAANFSREAARALIKSGKSASGLAPLAAKLREAMETEMVKGHCGHRPPPQVLSGMIEAQRARDALMAKSLLESGPAGAVLIAGAGHARRDRGAPAYLPGPMVKDALSIAFVEADAQTGNDSGRYAGLFDIVWFTRRAERADPCKDFRLPGGR